MSLSSLPKPIPQPLAHPLTAVCKRWSLQPEIVMAGATLWIRWAASTWAAFTLSLLFIEVGETGEVSWIKALLGGSLVIVGQWLALRPYLRCRRRWVGVTCSVWALLCLLSLGAVGWVVPNTPNLLIRGMFGLLYGSYVGLGLGLGQWWALRPQVQRAWRWIPLNAGIWAVGIAFAWIVGGLLRAASGLFLGEVIGLVGGWGIIAILSGIGLVGLIAPTDKTALKSVSNPALQDEH